MHCFYGCANYTILLLLFLIQWEYLASGKNKNQNERRSIPLLLRIANHHYVHDGVGEAGYITFELILAVVTLSHTQMFKWLLNGDVRDYKYVASAATVCLLLKCVKITQCTWYQQRSPFKPTGKLKGDQKPFL